MNSIIEPQTTNQMTQRRPSPPPSSRPSVLGQLVQRWHHDGWASEQLFIDLSLATTIQAVWRGLAHSIRNRLQVISMVGQTVTDSPDEPSLIERLGPMLVSAAAEVEEDLNRLSRFQLCRDDTPGSVVIGDVLTDSRGLIEKIDGAPPITLRVPDNLPAAAASHHDVWHAVLNLMLNAVEAQSATDDGTIEIAGAVDGGMVVLTVDDAGPGVPDHIGEQIFEPFFTTKQTDRHLGIGISVARLLANRWDGRLQADTSAVGGARMLLAIPAVDATTAIERQGA